MPRKTTSADTAQTYFDQFRQAFDAGQSKIEIPAAAREFVQRSAITAKERAESAHAGATNVATSAEKLAQSFLGGYADFTRGMIDATFANVQHSLATVEKLAAATSLGEMAQVQADFVRDSAKANYERLREATETARKAAGDGAEQVRAEFARVMPGALAA